jgi:hypothetical protein
MHGTLWKNTIGNDYMIVVEIKIHNLFKIKKMTLHCNFMEKVCYFNGNLEKKWWHEVCVIKYQFLCTVVPPL